MPLELVHVRWRILDPVQLLVLKEALLKRRPPRLRGGEATALTRDDRFALALAAARGVADVAASSDACLRQCLDGLAKLKVTLQLPAPRGAGPRAGGLAPTPDGVGGGGGGGDGSAAGEQCHACWGYGCRRTNTACPEPGELLCCSTCPHSWHGRCLPEDAMAPGGEGSEWSCPVCMQSAAPAGFVGNPLNKPAKVAQLQKRIKPAHEASKTVIRA